ncbi:hypothetical protein ACMHYO_16015 [Allopusillimonas ginsengisoli]|uniref:hypothetical protein n=1 Tax=Allopusillimonas ginsengisoli TaxID=453575 RepID=UPI0039C35792
MAEKINKWMVLAIVLLSGGWLVSTVWPGLVAVSITKDWWEIATAVGTVGATVAALCGFAWTEYVKRRDRRESALAYAPIALTQIASAMDLSSTYSEMLSEGMHTGKVELMWSKVYPGLGSIAERVASIDSSLLSALDGRSRILLIAAITELLQANVDVDCDHDQVQQRQQSLGKASGLLSEAYELTYSKLAESVRAAACIK